MIVPVIIPHFTEEQREAIGESIADAIDSCPLGFKLIVTFFSLFVVFASILVVKLGLEISIAYGIWSVVFGVVMSLIALFSIYFVWKK